MARELFENAAGDLVTALGRLVRIGRGSQGDAFARLDLFQIAPQQFRRVLLDIDFLFKLPAIAQFHEFVGVTRIAILAAELAPAVRIDGPGKRHATPADAAVQQTLRWKREVFYLMALAQGFAIRG